MIRRILLASAGALALAGTAIAADLPSRAPPPVYLPPPPLWTGFYAGINAGYTWSASNAVNTVANNIQFCGAGCAGGLASATASVLGATASLPVNTSGFIGGGQIGYNYQFVSWPSIVAGLEADIQGIAGANGSATIARVVPLGPAFPANSIATAETVTKSLDYLGTVRARLGFLVTPTLLAYATGGLAYGGANTSTSIFQGHIGPTAGIARTFGGFGSLSNTRVGWTVGGGAEWMFLPNWSAKIEYLYYDLGSVTTTGALVDPFLAGVVVPGAPAFFINAVRTSTRFNGNVVRAGINYHFNWGAPAPVVASY